MVAIDNALYLCNENFKDFQKLNKWDPSLYVSQIAAIDGGIGVLAAREASSTYEIWVMREDGTKARKIATTNVRGDGYGSLKSERLLSEGSLYSIFYNGVNVSTGSTGGSSGSVSPDEVLINPKLYSISFDRGLVSLEVAGVSNTLKLDNGNVFGFSVNGRALFEVKSGVARFFPIAAGNSVTNGRQIAFASGDFGHQLVVVDNDLNGAHVTGSVRLVGFKNEPIDFKTFEIDRPTCICRSKRGRRSTSG